MKIECPKCDKLLEVADDIVRGQHVRCPFCREKFSYGDEAKPKAEQPKGCEPNGVQTKEAIDPAEMQHALEACLKDYYLERLYRNAPTGARKVIQLSFYSTIYPKKIDGHKFRVNLRSVVPELTKGDLKYLIRYEEDDYLRRYFKKLLESDSVEGAGELREIVVPKRKLGVIRPSDGGSANVDLNAEGMKRRMEEAELQHERSEQLAAAARRKALVDSMKRHVLLLVIALTALVCSVAGIISWSRSRSRRAEEAKAAYDRIVVEEASLREAERQAREEREKLAEQERAAERERRRQKDAERQKELERTRQEARKAQEDARKAADEIREKYDGVDDRFRNAVVNLWSSLPNKMRPGAVEGSFFCVLPSGRSGYDRFEVASKTNGTFDVFLLSRTEPPQQLVSQDYLSRLESSGGLVARNDRVYLIVPKTSKNGFQIPDATFSPAEMCMGEIYSLARRLNCKMDGFMFEMSILCSDAKRPQEIGRVRFSDVASPSEISKFVAEHVRARIKFSKPKALRRTVMMYDGEIIKKGMNGQTYVPRNPIRYDSRWNSLSEEACRQERAANKREEDAREQYEEKVSREIEKEMAHVVIFIRICPR